MIYSEPGQPGPERDVQQESQRNNFSSAVAFPQHHQSLAFFSTPAKRHPKLRQSGSQRNSRLCACLLNRMRRLGGTSLREAVLILMTVALVSLTLTFNLNHHLHALRAASNADRAALSLVAWKSEGSAHEQQGGGGDASVHLNIHRTLQLNTYSFTSFSSSLSQFRKPAKSRSRSKRGDGAGVRSLAVVRSREDGNGTAATSAAETRGSAWANSQEYLDVLGCLQEKEQSTSLEGDGKGVKVIVAGSSPQQGLDALLVASALRKHSADVTYVSLQGKEGEELGTVLPEGRDGWSILLCINSSSLQDACVVSATRWTSPQPHQKINVIPDLQDLLSRPEIFCRHKDGLTSGRWLNSELRCTELSDNTEEDSACERHPLVLSPSLSTGGAMLAECTQENIRLGSIALALPNKLLTWSDINKPKVATDSNGPRGSKEHEIIAPDKSNPDWHTALSWRVPVLVTSLTPLRVYMHTEGVVTEGFAPRFKPKQGLSISELQKMASDLYGVSHAAAAVGHMEETVMDILAQVETLSSVKTTFRCLRCFQLLEMTCVFNTSFWPFILQVRASSLSGRLSSLGEYLVRQTYLGDLAVILADQRTVAPELTRALLDMGLTAVQGDRICNTDKTFCLGPAETVYLLDSLREHLSRTGWRRIYPSASAGRFTGILQRSGRQTDTNDASPSSSPSLVLRVPPPQAVPEGNWGRLGPNLGQSEAGRPLATRHLHTLLLALEDFFLRSMDAKERAESFEDVNIPVDHENLNAQRTQEGPTQRLRSSDNESTTSPPCSDEPGSLPYLSSIVTRPTLILRPEFSPLITEYDVTVGHTVQLVSVWAWSQSCQSQARLESKHNFDRSANFTLGLGLNELRIFVVDRTHDEPWVVNTYVLRVKRLDADHSLKPFAPGIPHVVCTLKQDCSMVYSRTEPCGLQPFMTVTSWEEFQKRRSALPECIAADVSAQWHVPCTSCREVDGRCYWKEAVWTSAHCQQPRLSQGQLQQCFKGKKVLFIGDSTNRGILHYIAQRVNGSLFEWPDKTHHLRIFPALNGNSTLLSFAYYPQFWLPALHRPVFDKALYQLIRRSLPLDNSSNTVLVVGGVHWLGTHHLKVVKAALTREGLTGVHVIVKGLGSGFHLPVSGVHQLSQKEQEKLLWHNQHVLRYARELQMDVVDTFNMTMARYTHFLQGRCSCHFHRITTVEHLASGKNSDQITKYKVEGEVNAAYSEIVINQICKPSA